MPSPYPSSFYQPGVPGGLGSYGFFAPPGPMYPHLPGVAGHSAGFNYSTAYDFGYGPGNQIGGFGVGAVAGLGMAGLGLGAAMSVFRPNMLTTGAFDPIGSAMGGWGWAANKGFGFAGRAIAGIGAAIPSMALMGGVSHIGGAMVHGAQQQAGLDRVLGQFNFMNPSAPSGRGFTRNDSMMIGNMVREMAHLPEMLTSVSELTRIMDKVSQMGLMKGSQDVAAFNQKFKQTVDTLKQVAKVIGTTMEDALSIVGEAKSSGFYSKADLLKNAMARQVASGFTGMSQQQLGQAQLAGSQIAHAYGGTRKVGALNTLRTASFLGQAEKMGILSGDTLTELTGLTGDEATGALATTMTESAYRMMSRSPLGAAITLGLGKMEGGRMVGIDHALAEKWRSGGVGIDEILALGRRRMQGRRAMLSYTANKNRYTADAAGAMGVEGITQVLGNIAGKLNLANNPDAISILGQNYGLDEKSASTVVQMAQELPRIMSEVQLQSGDMLDRQARMSAYQETSTWAAFKKKMSTRIHNALSAPFEKMGANFRNFVADKVQDMLERATGVYATEITKYASDLSVRRFFGDADAAQLLSAAGRSTERLIGGSLSAPQGMSTSASFGVPIGSAALSSVLGGGMGYLGRSAGSGIHHLFSGVGGMFGSGAGGGPAARKAAQAAAAEVPFLGKVGRFLGRGVGYLGGAALSAGIGLAAGDSVGGAIGGGLGGMAGHLLASLLLPGAGWAWGLGRLAAAGIGSFVGSQVGDKAMPDDLADTLRHYGYSRDDLQPGGGGPNLSDQGLRAAAEKRYASLSPEQKEAIGAIQGKLREEYARHAGTTLSPQELQELEKGLVKRNTPHEPSFWRRFRRIPFDGEILPFMDLGMTPGQIGAMTLTGDVAGPTINGGRTGFDFSKMSGPRIMRAIRAMERDMAEMPGFAAMKGFLREGKYSNALFGKDGTGGLVKSSDYRNSLAAAISAKGRDDVRLTPKVQGDLATMFGNDWYSVLKNNPADMVALNQATRDKNVDKLAQYHDALLAESDTQIGEVLRRRSQRISAGINSDAMDEVIKEEARDFDDPQFGGIKKKLAGLAAELSKTGVDGKPIPPSVENVDASGTIGELARGLRSNNRSIRESTSKFLAAAGPEVAGLARGHKVLLDQLGTAKGAQSSYAELSKMLPFAKGSPQEAQLKKLFLDDEGNVGSLPAQNREAFANMVTQARIARGREGGTAGGLAGDLKEFSKNVLEITKLISDTKSKS